MQTPELRNAGPAGLPHLGQFPLGFAEAVFLLVLPAVAANGQTQPFGQGIDHGDAHPVQATGDLVGIVVELSAGMEHGHDHLGSGATLLLVIVHGDATAVVPYRNGTVGMDGDIDVAAVAGQGLVDGVVDHLEDHVVQARAIVGIADVHARALAHRIEALEDLDVRGIVTA